MSEEENILDMADSDIDCMPAEEAQHHIDVVMRAARSDVKHPYFDGQNPDHRKIVEKVWRLQQIASPEPEPQTNAKGEILVQQWPRHMVKIMEEALVEQEQKEARQREKLAAEARQVFSELRRLGFEGLDAITPGDVTDWELPIWKMQVLTARHDWKQLRPLIERDIWRLKLSGADMFQDVMDGGSDDDKEQRVSAILKRIYRVEEARHTPKNPKTVEGKDDELL